MRIAPSLLSADFARLGEEVLGVVQAGADCIHLDVMDNHYVPNLTVGPMVCEAIRAYTKVPIDVHLMASPVDHLVKAFAKAGADIISFHPEASFHIDRTLRLIRSEGCKAGLAFNPGTPLNYLDHLLDSIDLILIMLVNPGFGGQQFIKSLVEKVKAAKTRIEHYEKTQKATVWLEVDGGVNLDNIATLAKAGADTFVAGSAIFSSQDYLATITNMKSILAKSVNPLRRNALSSSC